MDAPTPGADDPGALSAATADPVSSRAPSPSASALHALPNDTAMLSGDEASPVASTSAVAGSATAPTGGLLPVATAGSDAGGGMMERAKRARSTVKFSPAKGPKATSRRAAAITASNTIASTSRSAAAMAQEEQAIPNEDSCFSCGGRGHFLCCDGCPRSFHFSCLDPPLDLDEIPVSAWYCNVCATNRTVPLQPKGIFGPLILKVQCDNPTVFELPKEIRSSFKGITTGSSGEYIDTDEFRPLSQLGKPGKSGYEERDPYKLRDKQGRTVFCARCHDIALPAKQKKIIACDFCELHWHLDCVNPPLVGLPPVTRRWKCPIHADSAGPPRKSLKNPKIVKVSKQKTQNNGDIDIIPSKRITTNSVHVPEELISQGIRYQVPEQIVILDFWSRVKRDKYGMPFERVNRDTTPVQNLFDFSDSSSLTSMEPSPERDLGPARLTAAASSFAKGKNRADTAEAPGSAPLQREDSAMSDGDPPDIEGWKAHMLDTTSKPQQNGHTEIEGQDGMQVDAPAAPTPTASARSVSPDTRGAEQLFAIYSRGVAPSQDITAEQAEKDTQLPIVKQEASSRAPSPAATQIASVDQEKAAPNSGRSTRLRSKSPLPDTPSAPAPASAPIAKSSSTVRKPTSSRPVAGSHKSIQKPSSASKPESAGAPKTAVKASSASKAEKAAAATVPAITHTASSPIAAKHPPRPTPIRVSDRPPSFEPSIANGSSSSNGKPAAKRVDRDGDTSMS